jgi:tetratricopeptide (TPR) repeat protein
VVDSFDSPPALADQGLTGTVVAGRVLDQLTILKSATFTAATRRKTTNAWSQDIKVQVPQTGISLGEIDRLLRARLGRDTHIGGDLVQEPDGQLSLTVRGDKILPKTFSGPPAELGKLTKGAAEYIYGTSEPTLFAMYLSQQGRFDDSLAFVAKAYPEISAADRPEMLNTWGLSLIMTDKPAEGLARFRQALQINPRFWKVWANLAGNAEAVEGAESAYQAGMGMLAEARHAPAGEKMPLRYTANFYPQVQDWAGVIAAYEEDAADKNGGGRTTMEISGPLIADAQASLHNWPEVDRALLASDPDDTRTKIYKIGLAAVRALEEGDGPRAVTLLEAFHKQYGASCQIGQAYLAVGKLKEAEAAFNEALTPPVAQDCLSDSAALPEAKGDWLAAQATHAKSIALGPSLPYPHYRWGQALMRHGDLAAAEREFAIAHRQGPRWAEPLKAHGDLLAAKGRWAEAAAKYAQAEPLAPRWEQLHRAWAAASKASGDAKTAAAQLRLAQEIRAERNVTP